MAHYEEIFQGKSQTFTIRNATGSDAQGLISYMIQVNQETTFLSMEPGEFERSYSAEKEQTWIPSRKAKIANCSLRSARPGKSQEIVGANTLEIDSVSVIQPC